jgi:hypothetical protein
MNAPAFTNQPRSDPTGIEQTRYPKLLSRPNASGKPNKPNPTNHLRHQRNVPISYVPLAKLDIED